MNIRGLSRGNSLILVIGLASLGVFITVVSNYDKTILFRLEEGGFCLCIRLHEDQCSVFKRQSEGIIDVATGNWNSVAKGESRGWR